MREQKQDDNVRRYICEKVGRRDKPRNIPTESDAIDAAFDATTRLSTVLSRAQGSMSWSARARQS